MWNLSGDDVQRAKEELKGRRAAIQARYESELKQLETSIADIETFERAAVNFVASLKGEAPPAAAEPAPEPAAAESAAEPVGAEPAAVAEPAASEPAPSQPAPSQPAPSQPATSEPAPNEKGSSRWRMRLSGSEATP